MSYEHKLLIILSTGFVWPLKVNWVLYIQRSPHWPTSGPTTSTPDWRLVAWARPTRASYLTRASRPRTGTWQSDAEMISSSNRLVSIKMSFAFSRSPLPDYFQLDTLNDEFWWYFQNLFGCNLQNPTYLFLCCILIMILNLNQFADSLICTHHWSIN